MKRVNNNRNGKHREGNVRIGLYTTPEKKALIIYIARALNMTLTDVLFYGVEMLAKTNGILDFKTGSIKEKHKEAVKAIVSQMSNKTK